MANETMQISSALPGRVLADMQGVPLARAQVENSVSTVAKPPQKGAETVQVRGGDFARLQLDKEVQQNQAIETRNRLEALRQVEDGLRGMRENLTAIVKNYPPFPPGSEERTQFLQAAIGIRRQIEALMVPPPSEGRPPIPLIPKGEGLLPPNLYPDTATDGQIYAAIGQIDAALPQVSAQRSAVLSGYAMPGGAEAVAEARSASAAQALASLGQAIGRGGLGGF